MYYCTIPVHAYMTCLLTMHSTYMPDDRYRNSSTCAARLIDPSDDQASLSVNLFNTLATSFARSRVRR